MFLGDRLIETIQVNDEHVRQPGYLGKFKRFLKVKYSDLISESDGPPAFIVEPTIDRSLQERLHTGPGN